MRAARRPLAARADCRGAVARVGDARETVGIGSEVIDHARCDLLGGVLTGRGAVRADEYRGQAEREDCEGEVSAEQAGN